MWTNPHCIATEENTLLLDGRLLSMNISPRVPFMANMSYSRAVMVGGPM